MVEIIKKAAVEAVEASKPMKVVFGTVTAVNPIQIELNQILTLGPSFLVLTDSFTEKLAGGKIGIGSAVLLLQMQGGQRFVALDKVVSGR